MIVKILLNYIIGFVNITIEGFFVERFINNCINNRILLWSIKRVNPTLVTTNISIKEFKKIRAIARKTRCKININSKSGFPILLHKYRKRKLLIALLISILLTILITSNYIWNIEIIGLENIDKNEMLSQLANEGISIGERKGKVDVKNAINNIRLIRDDIAWMSVDMKGTNIIVRIVETEKKPKIIDNNEYCNIIANERGIITKITADKGTTLVKVGDIVEKGDILIGGYMEGKYTGIRKVHAKGNVEARVWYIKKIKSVNTREIRKETGNRKNIFYINFNNFRINLYKSLPNFENYDTINETKKIKILKNFYLPIEINKITYIEKEVREISYGKEELKKLLIAEIEKEFALEGIEELKVINKVVNFYEKEDCVELEMTYEIKKNIGIEEKIE